ncbi:hypothetical protein X753_10350 [Mesorhizobium sp. LNJC399B00]|uniref:hypothetical protein n=1 Tax=unclassified Mesorhizobium TaxID=325217 RepID=UPI0003CEC49B|nr:MULTISPECIES: hypothetical protein [unclassified Mesorhizobium]ESY06766.1 hypothetical protein X753_10350 [Mesorhizobium sp. LNJC399B00]WJI68168.1 hypothetical protein NLY36_25785 [Mesorhizobium sp. C399B]
MDLYHRTESGDPPATADQAASGGAYLKVNYECLEALENSLGQIKQMLDRESVEDDAMVEFGFSNANFEEPLNRHDMKVLACELYVLKKFRRCMTPKDVMGLTYEFTGDPMNGASIYKTIDRLVGRGMIKNTGVVGEGKNLSRMYGITEYGRRAFKMAILNARILLTKGDLAAA